MANKTNRLKKPQVPVVEWTDVQNAPVIATKTSELENDAKFQTKNQVVSEISARYKGAMRYLGQVATKENLPLGPEAGDTYQTMDTKELYCFDGVVWVKVGVTEVPEPPEPVAPKEYGLSVGTYSTRKRGQNKVTGDGYSWQLSDAMSIPGIKKGDTALLTVILEGVHFDGADVESINSIYLATNGAGSVKTRLSRVQGSNMFFGTIQYSATANVDGRLSLSVFCKADGTVPENTYLYFDQVFVYATFVKEIS